jgi:hypothetical protein
MPSALLPESNQSQLLFRMLYGSPANTYAPARVSCGSSYARYCNGTSREQLGQEGLRMLNAMRRIKSDTLQQGNSGKPRAWRFILMTRLDA